MATRTLYQNQEETWRGGMTAETHKAVDMLSAFQSVGVERFHVTLIDIDGHQLPKGELLSYAKSQPALRSLIGPRAAEASGYMPNRYISELHRSIGPLLKEAAARQHNVIIRPIPTRAALVQLDDPPPASIERLKEAAFLIHRTSATGHQVWLALDAKPDLEFKRRLKKGARADIMATGATRIAGSLNFKRSYAPAFPCVEIIHAAPGQIITRATLENLSILAPPEPVRGMATIREKSSHSPANRLNIQALLVPRVRNAPPRFRMTVHQSTDKCTPPASSRKPRKTSRPGNEIHRGLVHTKTLYEFFIRIVAIVR
jgi:hypothetical protein